MFRRLFWFLTGAATGVWATVRVGRAVRRLEPDSLAATAASRALVTGARLRLFAKDVRIGMAQRETELHDALGLRTQHDPEALPAGRDTPALPGQGTAGPDDRPAARPGTSPRALGRHQNRKDEH